MVLTCERPFAPQKPASEERRVPLVQARAIARYGLARLAQIPSVKTLLGSEGEVWAAHAHRTNSLRGAEDRVANLETLQDETARELASRDEQILFFRSHLLTVLSAHGRSNPATQQRYLEARLRVSDARAQDILRPANALRELLQAAPLN